MKDAGIVLELGVVDVPKSIEFYRDLLGMSLIETAPEPEDQAVWAELDFGGSRLMLQERSELERELPACAGRGPGAAVLVVRLEGRNAGDQLWESLNDANVDQVSAPTDTEYGSREFAVLDPDDYVVLVAAR